MCQSCQGFTVNYFILKIPCWIQKTLHNIPKYSPFSFTTFLLLEKMCFENLNISENNIIHVEAAKVLPQQVGRLIPCWMVSPARSERQYSCCWVCCWVCLEKGERLGRGAMEQCSFHLVPHFEECSTNVNCKGRDYRAN